MADSSGDDRVGWQLYRRLLQYVKPYRRIFFFAVIAMVVVAITMPVLPYFLKAGIYTMPEFLEYRYNQWARLIMAVATLGIYMLLLGAVTYSGALTISSLAGQMGYSVSLQVGWFKRTKQKYGEGRRLFLMAPIHHHYQKKGFSEPKIVTRFWIVGIMLAVISIVTLKMR